MNRWAGLAVGGALLVALWAPMAGAEGVRQDPRDSREDTRGIRRDNRDIRQDRRDRRQDRRGRRHDRRDRRHDVAKKHQAQ